MRDPEAYRLAGRKNHPHDPQQMLEHPYDFVSLPESSRTWPGLTHDRYSADRLSGTLVLVYQTEAPLHVGSGVYETAAECGLAAPGTPDATRPVKGIVRREGRPVLPGASWKGAVRARFEAITNSNLGLAGKGGKEWAWQVPEALRLDERQTHWIEIKDPRLRRLKSPGTLKSPEKLKTLSPAESLFGGLGYRGRIRPGEGEIEVPSNSPGTSNNSPGTSNNSPGTLREPLTIAPMDSPQMHRLAQPGQLRQDTSRTPKLVIDAVEGRKFYYDGPVLRYRLLQDGRKVSEPIDFVPAGSILRIEVGLRSIREAELGALLVAAGYGEDGGILRFGGYKSAGLGKVRLVEVSAHLHRGSPTRRWRVSEGEPVDLAAAVEAARRDLLDAGRLAELRQVTTMQRPGAEFLQPGPGGGRHG